KKVGRLKSIDRLLPRSVEAGINTARVRHPAILASGYNVDVAAFNVKVLEGQFLPTVSLNGSVSHSAGGGDPTQGPGGMANGTAASITATLSVPIYQGGLPDSQVR